MTNPFFDQNRYLWARVDAKALYQALVVAVTDPGHIELKYKTSADGLRPLMVNQPSDMIWKDALDQLAVHGALRKFLEQCAEGNLPAVRDAATVVLNARTDLDALIISPEPQADDVLVLDRSTLREYLAKLGRDDAPFRVLLVRGGPDSGKSQSCYLFEHAAREAGAEPVYMMEGTVGSVRDVFLLLFGVFGASDQIPPRGDDTDAWYREVCIKLYELASKNNRPMWIAVDDLGPGPDGAPLLDEQIKKFCEQFALQLINPSVRKWFRLMLIHYPDGRVPTRWKRELWREDRTCETDVQQEDVAALLRWWSARRELQIVEEELVSLAADVIAKAEAPRESDDACRLERIHDEVVATLRDLKTPRDLMARPT